MNYLYITVGAPRSGKDTWAREFVEKQPDTTEWMIVNRDEIRQQLFPFSKWSEYKFTKEKEKRVTQLQEDRMMIAKARDKNIICTDTNLNEQTRNRLVQWAKEANYVVQFVPFDVPLHILEERNADAPFGVSPKVLLDMYLRMQEYLGNKYVPDTTKPPAIIVDIDGTLADMGDGRKPYDWQKVGQDKVKESVALVVDAFYDSGYDIIIMSGRDGSCKEITEEWLRDNYIKYDQFLIRTAGDQRKDYVVKKELFDSIKNEYNIVLAIDDRDQVVNLWRSMGIECWQVGYGKF